MKIVKLTQNLYFLLNFFGVFACNTLKYFLFGNYEKRLKNIVKFLAKKNLLYVKVFQAISSNTELVTPEFSNYLIKFTDNVPYEKEDIEIENILDDIEEIGYTWPEFKITNMDILPYKSGTISVVYNAKMRNKDVVVKILRKNMDKKMKDALDQAKLIVSILSRINKFKNLNLELLLLENRTVLLEQVDFLKETFNIDMFERSNKNRENYIIPHVYNEFTIKNKRMIVMDKIHGLRLDMLSEKEKEEYILLITKFLIISIIFDGHYHGDLHQGNVLFMRDINNNPKIGIIDFGIVGKLIPQVQEDLHNFFLALVKNDYINVGQSVLDSLIVSSNSEENNNNIKLEDKVKKELISSFAIIAEEAIKNEGNIGPDEIVRINKILNNYNLKLSSDFCKIVLAMAVSKGLCESLCVGDKKYVEYINAATKELMDDTLNLFDI